MGSLLYVSCQNCFFQICCTWICMGSLLHVSIKYNIPMRFRIPLQCEARGRFTCHGWSFCFAWLGGFGWHRNRWLGFAKCGRSALCQSRTRAQTTLEQIEMAASLMNLALARKAFFWRQQLLALMFSMESPAKDGVGSKSLH